MKNWSKTEFLTLLLLALPFVYLAFTWHQYPAQVPIHFNHHGQADRYGSKTFGLLLLPAINVALYLLLKYLPRLDPRQANLALFKEKYALIRLFIHLFLVFIFFLVAFSAQQGTSPRLYPKLVVMGVLLLFIMLGNYFSTMRPNYFVGIRTPWTLENPEVWKRTHRFAGRLWVFSCLALLLVLLFTELPHPLFLVSFLVLISLIPMGYSYFLYRKLTHPKPPQSHS